MCVHHIILAVGEIMNSVKRNESKSSSVYANPIVGIYVVNIDRWSKKHFLSLPFLSVSYLRCFEMLKQVVVLLNK